MALDAGRGWIDQGIWPCSWITHPSLPVAPCGMEFRLKARVEGKSVRIHVAGDERYELFLDGEMIGWGSERGTVEYWYFDSYDLALEAGEHELRARVWAAGRHALRSQVSVGPGFLLASEMEGHSTGKALWEVRLLDGMEYEKPFDHDFFSIGWNSVQDAGRMRRAEQHGEWKAALSLHAGSTAGIRNRVGNIHLLAPATLPVAKREAFCGGVVRQISSGMINDESSQWQTWWRGREVLILPAGQERRVLIDLEDYVCAWTELAVAGGRGARIGVKWAESLFEKEGSDRKGDRGVVEGKVFVGVGDTFLPDGGESVFQSPFIRAGRYLELTVRVGDEPLELKGLRLSRAEYPLEMTGEFSTDLAPLESLLERCRRTVRASCHDNLIDGPYYEQMGWIGDTPQVALTLYSMTREARVVRKVLEVFDRSRLPGGMIRARWPARDSLVLPPYTLCWINVLRDFAWWRDEAKFVRARLPGMRAMLDGFLGWVDAEDGLLRIPVGWNFVDWVPGWDGGIPPRDDDGASGVFQWQLAWALRQAGELEECFGEEELAERYGRHARRVAQAAEIFWDEGRGLYADRRDRASFCEHAQAYAALSGLIPEEKIIRLKKGLVEDREITRATDPFTHYVFEAYGRLGLRDLIWPRMKRWFGYEALGLLTTPEGPEPTRSDCHAWGAHPHYHLFASLLGLRPEGPGFRQVRIDPLWEFLGKVAGKLPHPAGEICFRLGLVDGKPAGEVTLPPGVVGSLICPGRELVLREGPNVVG